MFHLNMVTVMLKYTANVLTQYTSVDKKFRYGCIFRTESVASGQYQISTHISVSDLYGLRACKTDSELIQIRFTVLYQTKSA